MMQKYLRIAAAFCAMLFWAATLEAKSKADKLFQQGQQAEQRQDYDAALDFYLKALDLKANDTAYTIAMRRVRFEASQKHVNAGLKMRKTGNLEGVLGGFHRALVADPSSSIALQEITRTQEMIRNANPGES